MRIQVQLARGVVTALLLAGIAVQAGLAARRRGAKWYPEKETTADMSGMNRIFVGWVDLNEDSYGAYGYSSKADWSSTIVGLNNAFAGFCAGRLPGKTVVGAKNKGDENVSGYDLYIKFTDVAIDYGNYHLTFAMHFIDPKTNTEIGALPARPYFGNDWGFANYLRAALDEASHKIKIEVIGPDEEHHRKIPLISK